MEILEIELHDPVLESRKGRTPPVAKSITQKHEIADNTVGNHGSIQGKSLTGFQSILHSPSGQNYLFRKELAIGTPHPG